MQPRLLHLHPRTYQTLLDRQQQAESGGAQREARRFHAVLLNHDGLSNGEIAAVLKALRSRVSVWLRSFAQEGWPALRKGVSIRCNGGSCLCGRGQLPSGLHRPPHVGASWSAPGCARHRHTQELTSVWWRGGYSGRFLYHFGPVFNAQTYLTFLDQVARCYHPRPAPDS
jgi:hypothetical protein